MPSNSEPPSSPLPSSAGEAPAADLERAALAEGLDTAAFAAREADTLIEAAGLKPADPVLDLCCGQGRRTLELARRGFKRVSGLDASRPMIRLARRRARQESLEAAFHEGDPRRFRLPAGSFACVALMGNALARFELDRDDLAVLRVARGALRPGGTLVVEAADGAALRESFEARSWDWVGRDRFVCRERSLASDGQRLVSREVVVHSRRGVIADRLRSELLYTEERLRELLEEAGFEGVELRTSAFGAEQAAGRLILTARAPKAAAATAAVDEGAPSGRQPVAVLLGDPRRPDEVKRGGKFNEEDLETVRRLKAALGELDGFEFEYLDNHDELYDRLRSDPPRLALNLCDEGFRNNAFLELHVPAMLEMEGVPYTGAGPACLGQCYNKSLTRAVAVAAGVACPEEIYFDPDDQTSALPSIFPALVKPNCGDNSVGIDKDALVRTPEELVERADEMRRLLPGRALLAQEFLEGAEYSVGIVGNPGMAYRFLPALEVDYSALPPELPKILGYESKWLPDSPYWTSISYREARIPESVLRRLQDDSLLLFERLGCRDYARFDFRADSQGRPKLLEVNPNPGWCWDGKMNRMAGMAGMTYSDLLRLILEAARERSGIGSAA